MIFSIQYFSYNHIPGLRLGDASRPGQRKAVDHHLTNASV